MSFKKTGDWAGARTITANLTKDFNQIARAVLLKVGMKGRQIARQHIIDKDLPWEPLAKSTEDRKASSPYPTDILREYGDLYNNITYGVVNKVAYVGLKEGAVNSEGRSLAMIAEAHEYGVDHLNLPSRKLWEPTGKEVMEWIAKNDNPITQFINKHRRRL